MYPNLVVLIAEWSYSQVVSLTEFDWSSF